jgi:hypothetical protein
VIPSSRNPLETLPSFKALQQLDAATRAAVRALLNDLRKDAAHRAEHAWRKHKGPMAAYWRAVSVYAGHTARGLR